MKQLIKSVVFGFLTIIMTIGQASAATTLRYVDGSPDRGSRAEAVKFFIKEAAKNSNGEVKFDPHWGGALLKWDAIMSGVGGGTADIGSVIAGYEPKPLMALGIGDLPLDNSDPWVGMRAMYDLMTKNEQMKESMAKLNLVYLSNFSTGPVQFECAGNKKIQKVEDIDGTRMRATSTYGKVLADLGANIINTTYGEVYQALDTGLVECVAGYFYAMRAYKTFEVADNVIEADWGQIMGFALVMNRDVWNELPPKQQESLSQAGSNMVDHFAKLQIEESKSIISGLKTGDIGRKVPVTKLDSGERQKLIDATQKYVEEWIEDITAQGMDGQAIWDEYSALIDKYEEERKSKGYPWER
ncbi:MAG: C4-dicarboxylate TRAP transporter substrate-binding protein [Marinobacter sp.]